jgi:ABC-type sugar transport system permease subunit
VTATIDTGVPTAPDAHDLATKDPLGSTAGTGKRQRRIIIAVVVIVILAIGAVLERKVRSTIVTVTIAVIVTGGIWVLANLLFNQVRTRWERFSVLAFGAVGALFGVVLHGNLLTRGSGDGPLVANFGLFHLTVASGDGFFKWVLGPLVGAAAFGGLGAAMAVTDDPRRRRMIAVGASVVIGLAVGALIREAYQPGLDPVAIVVYTAIGAALGAGLSVWRKRAPAGGALTGAAIGLILGAWGGADLGDGSMVTSILACVVPAALIGLRLGMTANPDYRARARIDERSRAVIFIGPALLFILVMLVVPALRTLYLSFLDRDSEKFVGIDNFKSIFTNEKSFSYANWTNMFTSAPFIIGMALLVIAVVVGMAAKKQTGRAVELGNPTMGPLVIGLFLVAFGVFTALRGTLINNLWWVVTVTLVSTSMGLAVAVLADNRSGEKIAKSLIFMPMAISLVGASIIWRFMYRAQDISNEQTGVMNAVWVGLGRLSTGSGIPTLLATLVIGLVLIGVLILFSKALVKREWGRAVVPGVAVLAVGWFFIRFAGIIGGGVGGFTINDGVVEAKTILFVQEPPYNNFWLMVILIWIQTGFSMVILSAAIKAVPTELIEAAKIDGATSSQVFWRVTLPQIATTIGVVVTTLIVLVMKVFDIVKVTTNGQFDTQVLANNMFDEAFNSRNIGLGAALAMLIFLSVLPVMYSNVRRMQKES